MVDIVEQSAGERQVINELVGAVLGARYRLDRVLGAGGMGAVFEGQDLRLGRAVAVKVMLPSYARDAEYVKRFLREAQSASRIRHRNVVVMLDYGEAEGGLVYSVMERLRGQDLEQFLGRQPGRRVAWEQACGLLVQIANGLRAAHAQGVIHRDVKPGNCFLTTEDDEVVVKMVDFGIAKIGESMQTQQLTGMGNVLGTPSYTAPELVLSGGPASPRSDVYSLGVVAYRMLTGRLPFTGKTSFEVMLHACTTPVPGLRELGVAVPVALEALVLEMLSKRREGRPADMGQVRQRLVALGRQTGVVPVVAEGSSALRLELEGAETSGVEEDTFTEVFDPSRQVAGGPSLHSGGTQVVSVTGGRWGTTVSGGGGDRTVMASGGVAGEPSRPSWATERMQPRVGQWLVGGGVIAALAVGGVVWMVSGLRGPERSAHDVGGGEVAGAWLPGNGTRDAPDAPRGEGEAHERVVSPESLDEEASGTPSVPRGGSRSPTGPPSDAVLKKKIVRKIATECAQSLGDERVTVMFDVTTEGTVKRLTAIPKGPVGECAKRQVASTKFRTRSSEISVEIVGG